CDKGLIAERGFLDAPGRPLLFGTTETFLRCFGLESIRDLPEASPVPEQLTLPEELPAEAAFEETSPEEVTQA
ncbi:MAG: SMC-Scp complex subunit ScpB, partial [Clostridia bacterium]|nr:SMC-Scp complex subunit ScpB [Clostridia bacterium]